MWLSKSYSLDPRSLSLLRIGISIVIIADLLIRGGDLAAHYTNGGIWPVQFMKTFGWKIGFWSFHGISGEYWWVMSLFIAHFIFAILLLFGYKTKLSTFALWLLYISLHNRNLFIQQAGDDLLRLVLFWGLFLPWNSFYSMDARYIKHRRAQVPLANLGYLLLIASLYFFTVALKYGPEWREEHTAIYYALSLEQLRLPFVGDWLYQYPGLMKILTVFVYTIELIIPFLIIFPSGKGYMRWMAFILIVILHAGIGLTLYVGLFFVINIVTAIGLIPGFVMDKAEKKITLLNTSSVYLKPFSEREKINLKWVRNMICALVIVISVIINLSSVKWFRYELRKEVMIPVNSLRLDQYWGMFSPNVLKRDGWYVYYGMDSLGRQWDLIRNADTVSFEKPKSVLKIHRTDRWRKLTENMQREDFTFLRPKFCKYVLKEWNKKHPEKKMYTLYLYYMQKETLPDYKTTTLEKKLYCICNDN